jgi:hypothetical protein
MGSEFVRGRYSFLFDVLNELRCSFWNDAVAIAVSPGDDISGVSVMTQTMKILRGAVKDGERYSISRRQ